MKAQNPQKPQSVVDLVQLKDSMSRFAMTMVSENGGFIPFARTIGQNGKMEAYGAGVSEQTQPVAIYELLRNAIRSLAQMRKIRASGLCVNVDVKLKGETVSAIRILLEHAEGAAIETRIKYTVTANGHYKFEPEESRIGQRDVFA